MQVVTEHRTRDWLHSTAGQGFSRCGPSNNRRAKAVGLDPSTTSRWAHGGNGRRSPVGEYFGIIWKLAIDPKTDPYPLLTEADAVAEQGMMRGRTDTDPVRTFWQLYRSEQREQGTEDTATGDYVSGGTDDMEALAAAHLAEAATQRRFAAVCRELSERGVDPRAEEWRAVR